MLRISSVASSHQNVILRVEGRVTGPWVTELWKACEKVLGEHKALKLDLGDVSFLDPAGVTLLSSLISKGVSLAQCSAFVAAQLNDGK